MTIASCRVLSAHRADTIVLGCNINRSQKRHILAWVHVIWANKRENVVSGLLLHAEKSWNNYVWNSRTLLSMTLSYVLIVVHCFQWLSHTCYCLSSFIAIIILHPYVCLWVKCLLRILCSIWALFIYLIIWHLRVCSSCADVMMVK